MKATEVFVPGSYPQHTYISRTGQGLEETLRDSLSTTGQIVSLSGPSKAGKTVLVERVVGRDYLIPISGALLRRPEDVWQRALDWINVPTAATQKQSVSGKLAAETSAKAGVAIPILKGEVGLAGKGEVGTETSTESTRERQGLAQVVREVANSDFVILVDDFHYMERDVQMEVAKSLKEATRLGVKIVTAAVSHRGDDVVRANPELRGRVRTINLAYWTSAELAEIANIGFTVLNAELDHEATTTFTRESAGSPQLMQSLCLQACFVLELHDKKLIKHTVAINPDVLEKILEQTSATTDYRSLVDVLDAGPRTRGTERKTYKFHDGSEGDVYRVVLRAVADAPPQLAFPYHELLERTAKVCHGESPVGSSVTGTCLHMAKIAQEKFPSERAIDWDEQKQVFDIPDPYLLFYLRWSQRLSEA